TAASQLDPKLVAPRVILAQLALNQGKPEAAIAAIEKTLEEKPRNVEPYLVRSAALAEEGRYSDAEKSALPLIDAFPQPPARAMTFRTLAWARLQQSKYEDSHKFAREALKYDPSSQEGLYLVGASQIGLNKSEAGIDEVKAAVEIVPGWAGGYEVL